jgi:carbonic anhydrase
MKKQLLISCGLLPLTFACVSVSANEKAHWGYSGHQGPDQWAQLSGDNLMCNGKNQSPINLTGFIEADLASLTFNYKQGGEQVINNGHTVQVNYQQGSSITIDGKKFNLLQFHFHAPSENHIKGQSYPLEAHLVHADKKGELAVVAVMFKSGKSNTLLEKAWKNIPKHTGEQHKLTTNINVAKLLPENRDYYRFNGSLTTPPCSEGVRWLVMKDVVSASKAQIKNFKSALHEANNRPIQPLNARVVMQ